VWSGPSDNKAFLPASVAVGNAKAKAKAVAAEMG